jgi:hypothetical protein
VGERVNVKPPPLPLRSEAAAHLAADVTTLRAELASLEAQIVAAGDVMLLQEVGVYHYSHPLDSAPEYKALIEDVESRMTASVKAGRAVTGTSKWAINGSEKEGAKMVADLGKLMLRAYNNEADNVLRTLKPHTVTQAVERLEKLRVTISKLGKSMKLAVTDEFHALRVEELRLTADYLAKVAEEREREREERARLREEEKAQKELEKERLRLESQLAKERAHYEAAVTQLRLNGDVAAVAAAESKLADIQQAIDGVVTRAANIRAGYVYVISNFGSFGNRVVKIGMTRRLEPTERVAELGDASVPFRFDVHAIIFSDDAVGLEGALHAEFAARRVNLANLRREFFYVTPEEVKTALLRLRGHLLTFADIPEALEWKQSESERQKLQGGAVT